MRKRWQQRVEEAWAAADAHSEDEVLAAICALVAEQPDDDAAALYEHASALDFVGREGEAEPLYRRALDVGLDEQRRPRAVIQLASTLRNLGRFQESIELLRADIAATDGAGSDGLHDARVAFLALSLHSGGDSITAVAELLAALAAHLPMYGRSVSHYAAELYGAPQA